MRLGIPVIEAADDRDGARVWRPYAEDGASFAVMRDEMGSHLVVHAVVAALVEEIEILVGEELNGVGYGGAGGVGHERGLVYRKGPFRCGMLPADVFGMENCGWKNRAFPREIVLTVNLS